MSSLKRALRQFTFGTAKTAGRNSSGRITSFHRGGGAKRLQRTLDLKRNTASSIGVVERIEYDPNRSSKIALVRWVNGLHLPKRRTSTTTTSAASSRVLQLDPAASNGIRGVLQLNSMLPHEGTTSRDVFFSAFSSDAKRPESVSKPVSSLGLPRIAVAASRPAFFAPRVSGEERLQVRNWKRNSDAWTHRSKRKAAISWNSISR